MGSEGSEWDLLGLLVDHSLLCPQEDLDCSRESSSFVRAAGSAQEPETDQAEAFIPDPAQRDGERSSPKKCCTLVIIPSNPLSRLDSDPTPSSNNSTQQRMRRRELRFLRDRRVEVLELVVAEFGEDALEEFE